MKPLVVLALSLALLASQEVQDPDGAAEPGLESAVASAEEPAGEPPGEMGPFPFEDRMADVLAASRRADWLAGLEALTPIQAARERLTEYERAEADFAAGYLVLSSELEVPTGVVQPLGAEAPFESARALSGPTPLRLVATYDAGAAHLETAERWRAHVPEILQTLQAKGTLPPPMPEPRTNADGKTEPWDPLALARAAYGFAKGVLIERLRADWRDVDTRANLELIQRRLRELDEIERQREEQEQQEESEDSEESDEGEEGEESEDSEDQEGEEEQQEEQEDAESEQEDQEEQEGDPEQPQEQEQGPEEVQPPEEGGEAQSKGEEETERHLTREEVMRLLDRLEELEDKGEALEAALRQARRIPVERDW